MMSAGASPASRGASRAPTISVTTTRAGAFSQVTIRMEGDLDASAIAKLRDAAFVAIGSRPDRLLLDLSAVPSVDTAALSGLITMARVASRMRIEIAVRPAAQLRRVFAITGLAQILPFDEPDEEPA